jgi:hypothetical protein
MKYFVRKSKIKNLKKFKSHYLKNKLKKMFFEFAPRLGLHTQMLD